jgi:hypothetical protein
MSLANPHRAKRDVIRINVTRYFFSTNFVCIVGNYELGIRSKEDPSLISPRGEDSNH